MIDIMSAVDNAYRTADKRGWDRIYVLLDIHGTIARSNYSNTKIEFLPHAIKALRKIGRFPEVRFILWTSCYPKTIRMCINALKKYGIPIAAVNRSLIKNTKTGDFRKKPYFSIIIDDKAGFDSNNWMIVPNIFQVSRSRYPIWRNKK